jgi:hypothetical protein
MKPAAPAPRFRPNGKTLCGLAAIFAAGLVAATATTSSAAPLDDCLLLPLTCPTISTPTLPPISVPLPLPTTAPTTTTTTTTAQAPTPSASTSSSTPPAQAGGAAASAPFIFSVAQISARRIGGLRRIDVRLSLSHASMVVAVLHRSDVPSLVAVRAGRVGANTFLLSVPARIRAGRHTLKLVVGNGTEQRTFTQSISIPK